MASLATRWREQWTEHRPAPLVMTDSEILDWMGEHCDESSYRLPTPNYAGGFTVKCNGIKTFQPSLRDAVRLAAAKLKEENE